MPEAQNSGGSGVPTEITPELAQKVAKEVVKMLKAEARVDNERGRRPHARRRRRRGL